MPIEAAQKVRPPDPGSMGKIRHIVTSAHKWGGDGRKPIFRKIRRVLQTKHPEVIAKAFGGNPNVAAAWIKNNWYRMRGRNPPPTRGKKKGVSASMSDFYSEIGEASAAILTAGGVTDCFFVMASDDPIEDGGEGFITKTIFRTGEWAVDTSGSSRGMRIDKEFLENVLAAWKDGVWPDVTVPLNTHDDGDITAVVGHVRDVWVEESKRTPGRWLLRAKMEITEPDVKAKVIRGTYPNVSVFIDTRGVQHRETGKVYPAVLKHACITHRPFVSEMESFGPDGHRIAAIAEDGTRVNAWEASDEQDPMVDALMAIGEIAARKGDISWDDGNSWMSYMTSITSRLSTTDFRIMPDGAAMPRSGGYSLMSMSDDKVLVRYFSWSEEAGAGDARYFTAGWERGNKTGEAVIDPPDEWVEVAQKWVQTTISGDGAWPYVSDELGRMFASVTDTEGGGNVAGDTDPGSGTGSEQTPDIKALLESDQGKVAIQAYLDEARKGDLARIEALEQSDKEKSEKLHRSLVQAQITRWEDDSVSPAVLVVAKAIMDADQGGTAVIKATLTHVEKDGDQELKTEVEKDLSVAGIVMALVDAIPRSATREKITAIRGGGDRPASESSSTQPVTKRADALEADLGIQIKAR